MDHKQDKARPSTKAHVPLAELETDHPLRVGRLADIHAECRNKSSTQWRSVQTWAIGKVSYNDLATSWTDTTEFRAPTGVAR